MAGWFQMAAGLAALPVSVVGHGLNRALTGSRIALTLRVKPLADSLERAQLLLRLRSAAGDPAVVAVVLSIEGSPGGWAAAYDLRETIGTLRRAGVAVYALLENAGNGAYWIAAACDRVVLVPTGELAVVGVGAELTFYGALLERLGVEPDLEAAGAYKSFGEPFRRSFASAENREAITAVVTSLQEQLVAGIAAGRGLSKEAVSEVLAQAPLGAQAALDAQLVDALEYRDDFFTWLDDHHGKHLKRVPFSRWALRGAALRWIDSLGDTTDTIAVLHLEGAIVMDQAGNGAVMRARDVVKLLKKVRKDDRVKGVVLHVNSPGGDALASDLMWREVELLGREKPVVACFEDVSASGGYYLSAPASEIVARPVSLTGSIGVFGGKLVLGSAMRMAGVRTEPVLAAPNANLFSAAQPFSDDQRARYRSTLQRFYDGFVERVASGRRTSVELIEPACRGRVWTGAHASAQGLVDREGDLFAAIDATRRRTALKEGHFRRQDYSSRRRAGLVSRVISNTLRELNPAAALTDHVLALSPEVQAVVRANGAPLALMPWSISRP